MSESSHAGRVAVVGSERAVPLDARRTGEPNPATRTTVTIVLRAQTSSARAAASLAPLAAAHREYLTREAFAVEHGATAQDALEVQRFAVDAGLLVLETNLARRSVVVEGTLAALSAAFGTELHLYQTGNGQFRGRVGELWIPRSLDGIVTGVFGLDERPQARAQFRRAVRPAATADVSYAPTTVAAAYQFPKSSTGAGQTVALIELGGGYVQADLNTYFAGLGVASPSVTSVAVDGASTSAGGDSNADTEVMLDIEVVGAIAPGAKIVVYFGPNTDQGFLDAVTTAIHDTTNAPTILSISWGGPESTYTAQALQNFDAAFADAATLGVTVLCAAGDNGSTDGLTDGKQHVDFPASSPHVLACGGTRLTLTGGTIESEVVWNDGSAGGATGGGVSDVFALPTWQSAANVPVAAGATARRGVPDVSGDADPETGYSIRVDGSNGVVGGTSAVAPLWAALVALLNAGAAKPAGFINAQLYAGPTALRDITSGNNGAFTAGPGWDACTGLGSPNGAKVAALLNPPAKTAGA